MLTSSQKRTVRNRAFKSVLEPAGFEKAYADTTGTLYMRRDPPSIQGIDYQRESYGGRYKIHVCFHYEFLPKMLGPHVELPKGCTFHVLDFIIKKGLPWILQYMGELEDPNSNQWWEYGETVDEGESILRYVYEKSIEVLDRYTGRWQDPHWFLDRFPLEMMELAHQRITEQVMEQKRGDVPTAHPDDEAYVEAFLSLRPFHIHLLDLTYLLGYISQHFDKPKQAARYARVGLEHLEFLGTADQNSYFTNCLKELTT